MTSPTAFTFVSVCSKGEDEQCIKKVRTSKGTQKTTLNCLKSFPGYIFVYALTYYCALCPHDPLAVTWDDSDVDV